jgi:outer membrane protein OmpA-like peptidoglycan-associated protein
MPVIHARALLATIALSAALGACAWRQQGEDLGPSPRPECATSTSTLYFEQTADELTATSAPIIREVTERVAACSAAGGELRRIVVIAYPDRGAGRREARAAVRARADAVREALIAAGAPADRIEIGQRPDGTQIMQRRAEVEVVQW